MKWLIISLIFISSVARAGDLDANVSGPDDDGMYLVQGFFDVTKDTQTVWNVLTDYNRMPEFLPSVTFSNVEQSTGNFLLVRQTFVAKVLFFNHSADALFEVMLLPDTGMIDFHDILHSDFIKFKGLWSVVKMSDTTGIVYRVELIPTLDAPHWVIRNVSHKMAMTLLKQLREEIEAPR